MVLTVLKSIKDRSSEVHAMSVAYSEIERERERERESRESATKRNMNERSCRVADC